MFQTLGRADCRQSAETTVLERDNVAVVAECFVYQRVRCPVENVTDVPKLPAARLYERPMGASRSGLLQPGAYRLELAEAMG